MKRWLSIGLLCISACVHPVFNEPTTVTTKTLSHNLQPKRLESVSVEQCEYVILIIPIPKDPRDLWDDLLNAAKAKGGNTVLDVEIRASKVFVIAPLFTQICQEAVGVAAKI